MKGIIFTEFIEMVEDRFSLEMAEDLFDACQLESGGEYTTVGTYDYRELLALVTELGRRTDMPVPDLVHAYGKHLFGRFGQLFPQMFIGANDPLLFLQSVDQYIHMEVRKLYHDAEFPRFNCFRPNNDEMVMDYRSARPFQDVAQGLIEGCLEHFQCEGDVQRQELEDENGGFTRFHIRITQRAALAVEAAATN